MVTLDPIWIWPMKKERKKGIASDLAEARSSCVVGEEKRREKKGDKKKKGSLFGKKIYQKKAI